MITVVVGAQYGGEGKGKICSYLGTKFAYRYVCRTGGVNSSHTVLHSGRRLRLRMVPASAVVQASTYVYGPGSLIHLPTLRNEMYDLGISRDRVLIDFKAGVVTQEHIDQQRRDNRYDAIGSTLTGTGYATAARALRNMHLARDYGDLPGVLGDTSIILHEAVASGGQVLLEGHQGSGLSNYHGDYPFTSSRDCIAAALLSEVGLGPRHELNIILVVKMYPTRNHGGILPGEMTLPEAQGAGIEEIGGGSWDVPDRARRVGRLDWDDITRAVVLNTPSSIALTGFDYRFPECAGVREGRSLSLPARRFIQEFEDRAQVRVSLVSTGPEALDAVWMESAAKVAGTGPTRRSA